MFLAGRTVSFVHSQHLIVSLVGYTSMIPVAIAMPLFNEAANISQTLSDLDQALCRYGYEALFIIQDDASTDGSINTIQAHTLFDQGRVHLATNQMNMGHGPSVMRAYSRAVSSNRELIVHIDSDGEVDAQSIVGCLDRARLSNAEVVIGLREGRVGPGYRRAVTLLLRLSLLAAFGVASPDVNSPVRVYTRSRLIELLTRCPKESVVPHVLLTILAHQSDGNLVYQPVRMVEVDEVLIGSTWRSSKRVLGIPIRFLKLVLRAFQELVVFRFHPKRG